jgi:hypothetical protein
MKIIRRVQALLFRPGVEWRAIERESGEPAHLFLNHVAILALIPALADFIGRAIIGVSTSAGTFRDPLVPSALNALISYFFSFVLVYLVALIADFAAPYFEGRRSFSSALKLSAYAFTPVWLAGIFLLVPGLRFLTLFGLYGVYLLWTGVPRLMQTPRDRALFYTAAITLGALVVTLLLAVIQGAVVVRSF